MTPVKPTQPTQHVTPLISSSRKSSTVQLSPTEIIEKHFNSMINQFETSIIEYLTTVYANSTNIVTNLFLDAIDGTDGINREIISGLINICPLSANNVNVYSNDEIAPLFIEQMAYIAKPILVFHEAVFKNIDDYELIKQSIYDADRKFKTYRNMGKCNVYTNTIKQLKNIYRLFKGYQLNYVNGPFILILHYLISSNMSKMFPTIYARDINANVTNLSRMVEDIIIRGHANFFNDNMTNYEKWNKFLSISPRNRIAEFYFKSKLNDSIGILLDSIRIINELQKFRTIKDNLLKNILQNTYDRNNKNTKATIAYASICKLCNFINSFYDEIGKEYTEMISKNISKIITPIYTIDKANKFIFDVIRNDSKLFKITISRDFYDVEYYGPYENYDKLIKEARDKMGDKNAISYSFIEKYVINVIKLYFLTYISKILVEKYLDTEASFIRSANLILGLYD